MNEGAGPVMPWVVPLLVDSLLPVYLFDFGKKPRFIATHNKGDCVFIASKKGHQRGKNASTTVNHLIAILGVKHRSALKMLCGEMPHCHNGCRGHL